MLKYTLLVAGFWPLYGILCRYVESLNISRTSVTTTTKNVNHEDQLLFSRLKTNAISSFWFAVIVDVLMFYTTNVTRNVFDANRDIHTNELYFWLISIGVECFKFACCIVVADIYFYSVHRWIFHHPHLYAALHKLHHEYVLPRATATLYCTTTEMLLLNQVAVMLGPMVLDLIGHSLSMITLMLWTVVVLINIVIDHAGISIHNNTPLVKFLSDKSKIHDIHHLTSLYNFGVVGMCDMIAETRQLCFTRKRF